jgi:hypothetical protein
MLLVDTFICCHKPHLLPGGSMKAEVHCLHLMHVAAHHNQHNTTNQANMITNSKPAGCPACEGHDH